MSRFGSWLQKPTQSWLQSETELEGRTNSSASLRATSLSDRTSSLRLAESSPNRNARHASDVSLLSLRQSESQLQTQLQTLLDAQAEALVAGYNGSGDHASETSGTSTAPSLQAGQVMPVRQPRLGPLGLRAARRAISRTMRNLASTKEEQIQLLRSSLQESQATVRKIEGWEEKRKGLDATITSIEQSQQGSRAQVLKEEGVALQGQIDQLELQLAELKSRHRAVYLELSTIENSVQSKLSSYRASLSMLDSEIQRFLESPPQRHTETSLQSPYLSLPPRRRTLHLALDHVKDMEQDLEESQTLAETERDALQEGVVVWKDVVDEVQGFERELQTEMQQFNPQSNPSAEREHLASRIARMDQVMSSVESKFKLAEGRGWKLLQCCIGAELDAFAQGRELLQQVSQTPIRSNRQAGESETESESADAAATPGEYTSGGSPGVSPATRRGLYASRSMQDVTDDDEPDPDLLISHNETDTESIPYT